MTTLTDRAPTVIRCHRRIPPATLKTYDSRCKLGSLFFFTRPMRPGKRAPPAPNTGTGKLAEHLHSPRRHVHLTYGLRPAGAAERRATRLSAGTIRYVYDDRGLISQRTDRNGAVTTYAYDADGELSTEVRPGNDVTTYQYDALERLVEADNASAELTFSYDDAGHVASQVSCAPQPQHADCPASGAGRLLCPQPVWNTAGMPPAGSCR